MNVNPSWNWETDAPIHYGNEILNPRFLSVEPKKQLNVESVDFFIQNKKIMKKYSDIYFNRKVFGCYWH